MFPQKEHLTLLCLGRPVVGAATGTAAGGDDSALRFFCSLADRILKRWMYTRNLSTCDGPDAEVVEESLVQSTTVRHQLAIQSVELLLCQTLRLQAGLQPPLSQ